MRDLNMDDVKAGARGDQERGIEVVADDNARPPVEQLASCLQRILEDTEHSQRAVVASRNGRVTLRYGELMGALMALVVEHQLDRLGLEGAVKLVERKMKEMATNTPSGLAYALGVDVNKALDACISNLEGDEARALVVMALERCKQDVLHLSRFVPTMGPDDVKREQQKDRKIAQATAIMKKLSAIRRKKGRMVKAALLDEVDRWLEWKE